MKDDELLRYSRHILLQEIGIEGQARIRAAAVRVSDAAGGVRLKSAVDSAVPGQ